MNTNDMYSREKLARIKQDEMLREAETRQLLKADKPSGQPSPRWWMALATLVAGTVSLLKAAAGQIYRRRKGLKTVRSDAPVTPHPRSR